MLPSSFWQSGLVGSVRQLYLYVYFHVHILTRKMFASSVFLLLLSHEIVVGRKENLVPSYTSPTCQFPPTILLLYLPFPPTSSVLGSQRKSLGSLRHLQPSGCSYRNWYQKCFGIKLNHESTKYWGKNTAKHV